MPIYKEYASVYDRAGHYEFSLAMIEYLDKILDRHEAIGQTMLDLACGTGTMALAMAQRGWTVVGVDGSQDMLREARRKADDADVQVTWEHQDMRELSIEQPVALATCFYDSLNYILESDDLARVFHRVYRALQPGGLFIFDMNTIYALRELWDDCAHVREGENIVRIVDTSYDRLRQRTSIKLICFVREGELYRKLSEVHQEQAYPREHVSTLLHDAGFEVEALYNCFLFTPPDDGSDRIAWVARRPQE